MALSRDLAADAQRLITPADACCALDRVAVLHGLTARVSPWVDPEVLAHVNVVASVAAHLCDLLRTHAPIAGADLADCLATTASLAPAEITTSLALATETLSLSSRLALSIARRLRRDRRRRHLAGALSSGLWWVCVVAARLASVYAVLGATLVPHSAVAFLTVIHILAEQQNLLVPLVARREPAETPPRIRKGHRHVVFTR